MEPSRSQILLQKLISNTLSPEELDELLAAMQEREVLDEMSDFLENYFGKLIERFDKPLNE